MFQKDLKTQIRPLVSDCVIETDLEIIIPEEYVTNISERLSLYSRIDNLKNEQELAEFSGTYRNDEAEGFPNCLRAAAV